MKNENENSIKEQEQCHKDQMAERDHKNRMELKGLSGGYIGEGELELELH